ncbi:hypothetical protein ACSBR1_034726 [Camellia fascicularis]
MRRSRFHCGIRRPARELMELFCGIITSSAFRFFRVVHAPIFLHSFASDRRHMKDSVGNWIAQPPAYEAIVAEDGTVHSLNEYVEISIAGLAKDIGVDLIDAVHSQKLGVTDCIALTRQRVKELQKILNEAISDMEVDWFYYATMS